MPGWCCSSEHIQQARSHIAHWHLQGEKGKKRGRSKMVWSCIVWRKMPPFSVSPWVHLSLRSFSEHELLCAKQNKDCGLSVGCFLHEDPRQSLPYPYPIKYSSIVGCTGASGSGRRWNWYIDSYKSQTPFTNGFYLVDFFVGGKLNTNEVVTHVQKQYAVSTIRCVCQSPV